MKILKLSLLGILALGLYNCGLSPEAACKEIITTTCQKLIECTGDAAKKLMPYLKDQASCETEFNKKNDCAEPNAACKDGKTYSASQAGKCIDDYKALTCEEMKAGKKLTSCDTVCQ